MIRQLTIRNLAVVDDLQVGFGDGLNVITGETGAGKSLLIGALRLLLGDRADRSMIRTGESQCMVSAEFGLSNAEAVNAVLAELGHEPCEGGLLIIRRMISEQSSRNLVNDEPVTLQVLKRLGEVLVDMHGPYDHQSLLDPVKQLEILDAFGGTESEQLSYRDVYAGYRSTLEQIERLQGGSEEEHQRQIEFLAYRVEEIERANLSVEEELEVERDHGQAANAQEMLLRASEAARALSEGEGSAFEGLSAARQALQQLAPMVEEATTWSAELEQAITSVQEIVRSLEGMSESLDASPERMQWLDERLSTYRTLKRKYGASVEEVLENANNWREQLVNLRERNQRLVELEQERSEKLTLVQEAGAVLRARREEVADHLSECITKSLAELGFEHGFFDVTLAEREPIASGMDGVEFGFAPNAGEEMRPLRTIASSGEISRVMLAVKAVLAEQDRIPVLVFDEIDANIGGEIGGAVGRKLAEVGRSHQLLCITHLPQVAACGRTHLAVSKRVEAGRTFTEVSLLDEETRPQELARMLGGGETGDVSLEHARVMLGQQTLDF